MSFNSIVKEKIARVIAEYFTTNDIVNVFNDVNIPTNRELFAKWRITLDAFNKMSDPGAAIPHILSVFCHPLSFQDPLIRKNFIKNLNAILAYEKLEIRATDTGAVILSDDGFPISHPSTQTEIPRTPIDDIKEAITFFKDEYNKVKMSGLTYEYFLGEAAEVGQVGGGQYDFSERLEAIKQLKNVGFITEYETEIKENENGSWFYVICKIDESKLTQKEAPPATDAGVQAITQKVVHEHTHSFINSIQEKGINLNHTYEKNSRESFYITKKEDDFFYKGHYLNLSKKADYYKVFCALYAKLPEGGEISYKDLGEEIKSRISKTKDNSAEEIHKYIQRNLTDRSNGFLRYAGIPETEDNGKPLIEVVRGSAIKFNNKAG